MAKPVNYKIPKPIRYLELYFSKHGTSVKVYHQRRCELPITQVGKVEDTRMFIPIALVNLRKDETTKAAVKRAVAAYRARTGLGGREKMQYYATELIPGDREEEIFNWKA